jgi:hypothetical protein
VQGFRKRIKHFQKILMYKESECGQMNQTFAAWQKGHTSSLYKLTHKLSQFLYQTRYTISLYFLINIIKYIYESVYFFCEHPVLYSLRWLPTVWLQLATVTYISTAFRWTTVTNFRNCSAFASSYQERTVYVNLRFISEKSGVPWSPLNGVKGR